MRKRITVLLAVLVTLMTPVIAFATEEVVETTTEEATGPMARVLASPIMPNLGEWIPMILAVGVLLWVLSKMVWPPIMKVLDEREEKIEGSIRTAEESKLEAEELLAQYQEKLEEGRVEAAAIVEEGRQSADEVQRDIIERAENEAAGILERAEIDAAEKEKAAASALQEKTASLAISIASKVLGEKLSEEDLAKAQKYAEMGG